MDPILFGPATIQFGTEDLGETKGGGSLNIVTSVIKEPVIGGDVIYDEVPLYGEGIIHKFEFIPGIISDSLLWKDFGELVITGVSYKITLYNCQIFLPKAINFGALQQEVYDINLFFKPDSNGNLYDLEGV